MAEPTRRGALVPREEVEEFKARINAHLAEVLADDEHPPGSTVFHDHVLRVLDAYQRGEASRWDIETMIQGADEVTDWRRQRGDSRYDDVKAWWNAFMRRLADSLALCPSPPVPLGDRIRAARLVARLTQAELAAFCGVHGSTVARWEAGTLAPTRPHRICLANHLGGNPSDYEE